MDAVLSNLRAIACPDGDGCKNASCPLQHNREKRPAAAGLDGNDDGSQGQDVSRKRLKMSTDSPEPKRPSAEIATTKKSVSPPPLKRSLHPPPPRASPNASSLLPNRSPKPSTKPVALSSSTPAKSTTVTTPLRPPSAPVNTPTSAGTTLTAPAPTVAKPSAPRKVEPLNPRHLKTTAPAPHDFRYKALKMLHEQYTRLNNELKKDAKDDENKLLLSTQELIWMALDEEEKMATDKPSVYQNIIKHRIMHYKRMTPGQWRDERLAEHKKKVATLTPGKSPPAKLAPGQPREINTGLTPQQEVAILPHLLTPITDLSKFNYVPTIPTDEVIAKAREGQEASLGWEKCDRCQTRFQVFPGRRKEDGALTTGGTCTYHWGKLYYPERAASNSISKKKYKCCGESAGQSAGCITGDSHVFKAGAPARLAALLPFVETPPNPSVPKDRAVCFDCEMGYTVYGLELLRLTATSWPDGRVLLDVLVYPVGEIIDLNSRYSGVWPEDLVNAVPWTEDYDYGAEGGSDTAPGTKDAHVSAATGVAEEDVATATDTEKDAKKDDNDKEKENGEVTEDKGNSMGKEVDNEKPKVKPRKKLPIVSSPAVARDLFFKLISPETPLIGHGLENDLNALRVVHPTIVDTVLLFPHRMGLPIRHGLKQLMAIHLNKAIQVDAEPGNGSNGVPLGHDSAEDARAAGELVRYRVMMLWRKMQKQGWKLVDGEFVPPPGENGKGSEGKEEEEEKEHGQGGRKSARSAFGIGGLLTEGFLEAGQSE